MDKNGLDLFLSEHHDPFILPFIFLLLLPVHIDGLRERKGACNDYHRAVIRRTVRGEGKGMTRQTAREKAVRVGAHCENELS